MNLRIADARLESFIAEDLPYLDLTSEVLGVGTQPGEMEYYTREDCVVCCTEEAARIIERLGATVTRMLPSGTRIAAGESFLFCEGPASALHAAWKVCLNLFDHTSAVATNTARMVDAVKAVNPACEVLTTRKSMPGCKDILTKAVMAGGAWPHRLGLSETVLVFDHHITFLGGFDAFVARIPEFMAHCVEKKFFVEATAAQARVLVEAGVDGVQFDKATPEELTALVPELKAINPRITLIAAGGVNASNAAAYAAASVDGLATTFPFNAKPLDMSVRMRAL